MARRVLLVGIVLEICDETFHVDRRERAQPGNGCKESLCLCWECALPSSVIITSLTLYSPSLAICETFARLSHTNQGNVTLFYTSCSLF